MDIDIDVYAEPSLSSDYNYHSVITRYFLVAVVLKRLKRASKLGSQSTNLKCTSQYGPETAKLIRICCVSIVRLSTEDETRVKTPANATWYHAESKRSGLLRGW